MRAWTVVPRGSSEGFFYSKVIKHVLIASGVVTILFLFNAAFYHVVPLVF